MLSFGDRVRAARVAQGMSQEQLGAPTFSRSYMSLMESGMRSPTPEVIAHVADRLGLPRSTVEQWHALDGETVDIAAAVAQVEVMSALVENDLSGIVLWIERLHDLGADEGRLGLWWTSSYVRVMCHLAAGEYDEAAAGVDALAGHWISTAAPALEARVHGLHSQISRARGELDQAVDSARAAMGALRDETERAYVLLPACTTLVSALAELGRLEEARGHMEELTELADAAAGGSNLDRGRAAWVLGNLHFLSGQPDEGRREHDKAIALIDPQRHLRMWGRLHRSSAAMRVKSGSGLDDVPALLRTARTVAAISATSTDEAEVAVTEGMYAVCCGEWAAAVEPLTHGLAAGAALAPQTQAEAHEALGLALQHVGRGADATEHLRRAVALFAAAGAHARALEICRDHGVTPPPQPPQN